MEKKLARAERDAMIRASDEHWSALSERTGLSRSSLYRIRKLKEGNGGGSGPSYDGHFADAPQRTTRVPALRPRDLFDQRAVSGVTRVGGTIAEEYQRELQEDRGMKLYREMADHPVAAAVLFAIKMALRSVDWHTEPSSDSAADRRAAEFIDECREDMAQDWSEIISQIFSMLIYGFQPAEIVYKKRSGQNPPKYIPDPAKSKYSDGLIGWRRFQFISPTTLTPGEQWIFDEYGRVQGLNQSPPPDYRKRTIPIEKLLLFRTEVMWDSPEGRSILRPMYKPWYYAENLSEIEAIGAERLGLGLPVIYLGTDCTKEGSNSDYAVAQDIVVNVRADEQMGVVIPKAKMGAGAPDGTGVLFELVSPPSRGMVDFDQVITRYEQRMAMPVLAQFIFLGLTKVGTQSLAGTMVDFFSSAIAAWSDAVAGVLNRFGISRLLRINSLKAENDPRLVHSELDVPDLAGIANYINSLVGVQVIPPYPELRDYLLRLAGLPDVPEKPATLSLPAPSENYALRRKPGGPKWEAATNTYQSALESEYGKWADDLAPRLVRAEPEDRESLLEEAVAALILLLSRMGQEALPRALEIGLAGNAAPPEAYQMMADVMRENQAFLNEKYGPRVVAKVGEILGDPLLAQDPEAVRAVLETLRYNAGLYAAAFWAMIQYGVLYRSRGRVTWKLDDRAKHCWQCPELAGEYESVEDLLSTTGGIIPGRGTACNGGCRCEILAEDGRGGFTRW